MVRKYAKKGYNSEKLISNNPLTKNIAADLDKAESQ